MSHTRKQGAAHAYQMARYFGRGRAFASWIAVRRFVTGSAGYYRIYIS